MKFFHSVLFVLIIASLCFCQTKKKREDLVKGDFVFQSVQLVYFEGNDDDHRKLDSLIDNNDASDQLLLFLKELRDLNLSRTPFIRLRSKESEHPPFLFLDWETYRSIKDRWDCWELRNSGMKVTVEAEVERINLKSNPSPAFRALKPPKFEIVKGQVVCK